MPWFSSRRSSHPHEPRELCRTVIKRHAGYGRVTVRLVDISRPVEPRVFDTHAARHFGGDGGVAYQVIVDFPRPVDVYCNTFDDALTAYRSYDRLTAAMQAGLPLSPDLKSLCHSLLNAPADWILGRPHYALLVQQIGLEVMFPMNPALPNKVRAALAQNGQ